MKKHRSVYAKPISSILLASFMLAALIFPNFHAAAQTAQDFTGDERMVLCGFEEFEFNGAGAIGINTNGAGIIEFNLRNTPKASGEKSLIMYSNGSTAAETKNPGFSFSSFIRQGVGNTSNWKGAEYFEFWVKNGGAADTFFVDFYENDPQAASLNSPKYPWRSKASIPSYFLISSDGTVTEKTNMALTVPAGFEGTVKIPMGTGFYVPWTVAGDNNTLELDKIVMVSFGWLTDSYTGKELYFDDIAVSGNDLLEVAGLDLDKLQYIQINGFEENEGYGENVTGGGEVVGGNDVTRDKFRYDWTDAQKYTGKYSFYFERIQEYDSPYAYIGLGFSTFDVSEEISGDNKGNWKGAEALAMWVKNEGTAKTITPQFYEAAVSNGTRAPGRPWQLTGSNNTRNVYPAVYYLVKTGDGSVTKVVKDAFVIPENFEGIVIIPLTESNFEVPAWYGGDKTAPMNLDDIAQININIEPCKTFSAGKLYIDGISIAGESLDEAVTTEQTVITESGISAKVSPGCLPDNMLLNNVTVAAGAVSDNTTLNTVGSAFDARGLVSKNCYYMDVLDLNFESVTLAAPVSFSIPVPEGYEEGYKLYRYSDTGEPVEISYTVAEDVITFSTQRLGIFVLAIEKQSAPPDDNKPEDPGSNPDTGDSAALPAAFLLCVVSLSLPALLTGKKAARSGAKLNKR